MLKRLLKVGVPVGALLGLIIAMIVVSNGVSVPVLETRGIISEAQRNTMINATLIMCIIVIPVFILTFFITYRYRATAQRTYTPEVTSNPWLEAVWWGVPIMIVAVLSVIAWQTSHSLDPFKAIESDKKPVRIQVIALQWKWLFIYPDHNVASIGEFAMPVDRPVEFTITSDAPMNSFWIPQLGGQVYAMAGMSTRLSLQASTEGDYRGSSANISGKGHASMTFIAKARSEAGYADWLAMAHDHDDLTSARYEQLRLPSLRNSVTYYDFHEQSLYSSVLARYDGHHMGTPVKTDDHMTEGH